MKKLTAFTLALLLCACARPAMQPAPQPGAMKAWENMARFSDAQTTPYRLALSMRLGETGGTRRVTGLLWGNGGNALRLDVMAGVGTAVAMLSERGDEFLIFAPRENKAYRHEGESRPLLKIGVPVPINLPQLANLLTGRYTAAFGAEPARARPLDGGAIYTLDGPLAGELEVCSQGAPRLWRQQGGGWKLAFAYGENPLLPKSLRLENINGKMAVILVKERETPAVPFTEKQLELTLPPGAPVLPLVQFRAH